MSLHALAYHMAEKGRGTDSMLIHMSPDEVNGLQALAMAHGGSLTINPQTGLPEAGFLDSLLPALVGFGLNMFLPGLGEAVGGIFGLTGAAGAAAGTGIAVGGATALATGDLSKGFMAGLGAYGGAGLGGSLSAAGKTALDGSGFVQAPGEMGRMGAMPAGSPISTLDRLQAGANIAMNAPTDFVKSNYMNLGYAAAPGLSGAFEEEEASTAPQRQSGNLYMYKKDPITGKSYAYKTYSGDEIKNAPPVVFGNANGGLMGYDDGGVTTDTTSTTKNKPVIFGNVTDPDLPVRDMNDRRSDSEKVQDYLMGMGPNPFTVYHKTAVERAAEATKEIAKLVEQQQKQRQTGAGLRPV